MLVVNVPDRLLDYPIGMGAIALGVARVQRDAELSDPITVTIDGGRDLAVWVEPEHADRWAAALGLPKPTETAASGAGWRRLEARGWWDRCPAVVFAITPPDVVDVLAATPDVDVDVVPPARPGRAVGTHRVVGVFASDVQADLDGPLAGVRR